MIYTQLTKKAMRIAFDAHKDQVDRSGVPYIFHPMHLAEQMTDEERTCAALLHDVVEDTDLTFEDLAEQGIPETVIAALKLLTHDDAVPYLEYVGNIKENPIAASVKLADLRHNSDLTRLDAVSQKDLDRVKKYSDAIALLIDQKEK